MKERYKKLIAEDEALYERLKSEAGRVEYWSQLLDDTNTSDLAGVFEDCLNLQGNVIECGVWRGRTAKILARAIAKGDTGKKLYACDSFEGFGDDTLTNEDVKLFRPISRLKRKFTAANDVPDKLDRFFN